MKAMYVASLGLLPLFLCLICEITCRPLPSSNNHRASQRRPLDRSATTLERRLTPIHETYTSGGGRTFQQQQHEGAVRNVIGPRRRFVISRHEFVSYPQNLENLHGLPHEIDRQRIDAATSRGLVLDAVMGAPVPFPRMGGNWVIEGEEVEREGEREGGEDMQDELLAQFQNLRRIASPGEHFLHQRRRSEDMHRYTAEAGERAFLTRTSSQREIRPPVQNDWQSGYGH